MDPGDGVHITLGRLSFFYDVEVSCCKLLGQAVFMTVSALCCREMFEAKRNIKRTFIPRLYDSFHAVVNLQNNKRLVKHFSQLEDLNEDGHNVAVIKETERILLEFTKASQTFSHQLFILLESDLRISKPGKFTWSAFVWCYLTIRL